MKRPRGFRNLTARDRVALGWQCPAAFEAGPERLLPCGRIPDHEGAHSAYDFGTGDATAVWLDIHPLHRATWT